MRRRSAAFGNSAQLGYGDEGKELHQMVDVLEFSARDWVSYDTSDYGRASAHLMAEQGKGGRQ